MILIPLLFGHYRTITSSPFTLNLNISSLVSRSIIPGIILVLRRLTCPGQSECDIRNTTARPNLQKNRHDLSHFRQQWNNE
jgi:hypothetical protein